MKVSMGAPNLLRGGAHSGNVSAAELAAEGLLDNLASDYVPGSLLHAAFRLTEAPHGLTLPQAVAAVASRPAETARLTDRGRIAPGLRAQLVRVAVVGGQPFVQPAWREAARVLWCCRQRFRPDTRRRTRAARCASPTPTWCRRRRRCVARSPPRAA